jgi:hypothetical protein
MNVFTEKNVSLVTTVNLTKSDVLDLVSGRGIDLDIPNGATDVRVFVKVPGGGDWSNSELEIDMDTPIVLQYTEKSSY